MTHALRDIPEEDLVAVRAFAGNEVYQQINTALRAGDDAVLDRYDALIRCAVSGINQLPPYRGVVISGGELDHARLASYTRGAVLHEPAFVSTTRDPRLEVPGNVRFAILSRHGHDISSLSPYPDEAEVLFGPGYRYAVISAEYDTTGDTWLIALAEGIEPDAVGAAELAALSRFAAEWETIPPSERRPINRPERFSRAIGD